MGPSPIAGTSPIRPACPAPTRCSRRSASSDERVQRSTFKVQGVSSLNLERGADMPDVLGYRAKIGVLVPATNTIVEPEYHAMAPRGVTLHTARFSFGQRELREAGPGGELPDEAHAA